MPISFADRVRRLGRASRVFPNIGLAGVFDPLSQTVTVLIADEAERTRWGASENPLFESREFLATAVHELTHWLDGTSTLWGQSLLVDIHNAMTAWSKGAETEFWRVLALHNRLNRGGHSRYYAVVDQPDAVGDAASWKVSFSTGLEYGVNGQLNPERPLVFVSFTDVDGNRICRVPLTEMALLEANAMWAEFESRRQLTMAVPEEFRVVESAGMSRELMKFVYTPSLAIYSAAVHLVANFHRMTHLAGALEAAGRLATVALNTPARLVANLKVPLEVQERWEDRVDALRRLADPGFLFFVLCQTAPRYEPNAPVEPWVDAALRAAGLPSAKDISAAAAAEMHELPTSLLPGSRYTERAGAILKVGRENFAHRGVVIEQPLSVTQLAKEDGLRLPPAVLLDETLAPLTPNPINEPILHPLDGLEMASRFEEWSSTFVDAIRF